MDVKTTKELNGMSYKELKKQYGDNVPKWARLWEAVEKLANNGADGWDGQWLKRHKKLYRLWEAAHRIESTEIGPIFSDEGGYIPVGNFIEKETPETRFKENRDKIAALTHRDDTMRCPGETSVKSWEDQKPRILFIGREANCFGEGLDWALDENNPTGQDCSWFRQMANDKQSNDKGVTKIAFASYLLLKNADKFKEFLKSGNALSPCAFEEYDPGKVAKYYKAMKNVAIMNLNKRGGFPQDSVSTTLYGNVANGAYLLRYTPFILAEIKLFNPDIIVFMGPSNKDDWKWFKKMLTDSSVPGELKLSHNVILCDTYHFSFSRDPNAREDFVRRILGIEPISKRYRNYKRPQLIPSSKFSDS